MGLSKVRWGYLGSGRVISGLGRVSGLWWGDLRSGGVIWALVKLWSGMVIWDLVGLSKVW